MQVGIFSWICKFGIRRDIRARTRKRTMVLFHSSFPADASSRVQSPVRPPGGGHGNPLQYSCLENPMDRRAWETGPSGHGESYTTEHTLLHSQSREKRMNKKPRLRRSSYQNRRESPGLWKGRTFIKNQWSTASLLRTKKLPLDLAIWRLFMTMTRAFLVKWWGELFLMEWVERKKAVCQISDPGHKSRTVTGDMIFQSSLPNKVKHSLTIHSNCISGNFSA